MSAGVAKQYSGTVGAIEHCEVGSSSRMPFPAAAGR
jgi:hypothetical protein